MLLLTTCVKIDIFPRPFATGLDTGFGGLKNVWFKSADEILTLKAKTRFDTILARDRWTDGRTRYDLYNPR